MSKLLIFTVRDNKAEAFMRPFFARARGEAIRSFGDEVNTKDTMLNKYPADFELFYLGEFDEVTAGVKALSPESLGSGLNFIQTNE